MTQLIQNLVGNGIKYCNREKAIIKISVKENANEWEFSVIDNGIGIAPDYYQKIFIIFQRLHQVQMQLTSQTKTQKHKLHA